MHAIPLVGGAQMVEMHMSEQLKRAWLILAAILMTATGAKADVIEDYWYIVAESNELRADAPLARTVLDERLVCFRGMRGEPG